MTGLAQRRLALLGNPSQIVVALIPVLAALGAVRALSQSGDQVVSALVATIAFRLVFLHRLGAVDWVRLCAAVLDHA